MLRLLGFKSSSQPDHGKVQEEKPPMASSAWALGVLRVGSLQAVGCLSLGEITLNLERSSPAESFQIAVAVWELWHMPEL